MILSRYERILVTGFVLLSAALMMLLPVSVHAAASASFDDDSLTSTNTKPTLEGSADDLKSVRLVVSSGSKEIVKKTVKVKRGEWKQRVTKSLPTGTYEVKLLESSKKNAKVLDTGTLTISKEGSVSTKASKSSGIVSVSSVPLFLTSTIAQGGSAPIAYLKVQNSGKEAVTIEGFDLKQMGSASADSVIGFVTSDDKGGSRATIGGTETSKQFKKGVAFVPLAATIAPGQMRIFTVKAIMAKNAGTDLGKQLFIDVTGIRTNGIVKSGFPVRGTGLVITR